MTYQVQYTAAYTKKVVRFLRKNPDLIEKYQKTMLLLESNPHHPSLRLHKLSGHLSDCHSVSINLSCRIVLYFLLDGANIVPIQIGSHDEVYSTFIVR